MRLLERDVELMLLYIVQNSQMKYFSILRSQGSGIIGMWLGYLRKELQDRFHRED